MKTGIEKQTELAEQDARSFFALSAIPARKRTPNQAARLAFLKVAIPRYGINLKAFINVSRELGRVA